MVISSIVEFFAHSWRTGLESLTTFLFLIGYLPYWYQIWSGEVRPVRSMWVVWFLVNSLVTYSMWEASADISQIGAATAGSLTILLLMFWKKQWRPGWTWSETLCVVSALAALLFMVIAPEEQWHILIPSVAMGIAGIPAIQSAWSDYRNEGLLSWVLWMSSCVPALLIVHFFDGWSIATAAQKVSFVIFDVLLLGALLLARGLVAMGYKKLP